MNLIKEKNVSYYHFFSIQTASMAQISYWILQNKIELQFFLTSLPYWKGRLASLDLHYFGTIRTVTQIENGIKRFLLAHIAYYYFF